MMLNIIFGSIGMFLFLIGAICFIGIIMYDEAGAGLFWTWLIGASIMISNGLMIFTKAIKGYCKEENKDG